MKIMKAQKQSLGDVYGYYIHIFKEWTFRKGTETQTEKSCIEAYLKSLHKHLIKLNTLTTKISFVLMRFRNLFRMTY